MLGNLQAWISTLRGSSLQTAGTDSGNLPAGARVAHRGGSFKSQPGELRCAARGSAAPDSRIPWRGFRVAMEG